MPKEDNEFDLVLAVTVILSTFRPETLNRIFVCEKQTVGGVQQERIIELDLSEKEKE